MMLAFDDDYCLKKWLEASYGTVVGYIQWMLKFFMYYLQSTFFLYMKALLSRYLF